MPDLREAVVARSLALTISFQILFAPPLVAAPTPWEAGTPVFLGWVGEIPSSPNVARMSDGLRASLGREGLTLLPQANELALGTVDQARAVIELAQTVQLARAAVGDTRMDRRVLDRLRKAAEAIAKCPGLALAIGPLWQEALSLKGVAAWRDGRKDQARAAIAEALRFHPTQDLPAASPWDWDEGALGALAWENWVSGVRREVSAICTVEVLGLEPSTNLHVNGFSSGRSRALSLPAGEYRLEAQQRGRWLAAPLTCDRQSRMVVSLHPDAPPLFRKTNEDSSKWLIVDGSRDELQLFLYTPEIALDAVPLRSRWRVADASGTPTAPIATDAFRDLLQRHALAPSPNLGAPVSTPGSLEWERPSKPRWYNDWRVWAVAGAVVGGAVTLWLATRDPNVHAQAGGLSIRLE